MKRLLTILLFAIGALVATLMSPTTVESYEGEGVRLPENPTYWEYAFFHVSEKWGIGQTEYFYKIIEKESSWRVTGHHYPETNKSSATGLAGFLDATWSTVGCEKTYDGYEQIDCAIKYIEARYKTPEQAWGFHLQKNWY